MSEHRIRGYVLRSPGLEPVVGAAVVVTGCGIRKVAHTDHEGAWAMVVARGGYHIEVGGRTLEVVVLSDARYDMLVGR